MSTSSSDSWILIALTILVVLLLFYLSKKANTMSGKEDDVTGAVRASSRANKGKPPGRYTPEEGAPQLKATRSSRKSTCSKANSAGKRSGVEAERDQLITQLETQHAEAVKSVGILKINLNRSKRKLACKKHRSKNLDDPDEQEEIQRMEEEIADQQDEIDLQQIEVTSLEATLKGKIAAAKSKCAADLFQITSEDEEESDDGVTVDVVKQRTDQWAEQHQQEKQKWSEEELEQDFQFPPQPPPPTSYPNMSNFREFVPKQTATPKQLQQQQHFYSTPPPPENKPIGGEGDLATQLAAAMGQALGKVLGGNKGNGGRSGVDYSLPKFNGNPGDWENFKAEYLRTFQRYEDSENVCRLRSSLGGDALTAVKHLMANPSNLNTIMDSLQERFGRPELVLDYLVDQAKAAKPPDPSKPQTIIDFGTAVEALHTNVCAYNEADYMGNRQLINELAGKLPTSLKTDWHKWMLDDNQRKPNLEYFAQWLKREVRAAIMAVKPSPSADNRDEERKRGRFRGHGVVNVVTTEENESKCVCCGRTGHELEKCWKFSKMNSRDRWEVVKETKVCLSCLKEGHRSRKCSKAAKCVKDGCPHFHHILLHSEQRIGSRSPRRDWNERKSKENDANPTVIQDATKEAGMFNVSIIEGTDGPLQIIPVKVKRANGEGTITVHAFLDGGATHSMILKSLAKDLGLNGTPIPDYKYFGINGESTTVRNAIETDVEMAGVYVGAKYHKCLGAVTVDAMPLLPYSFNAEEAIKTWPHLRQLRGKSVKKVTPQIIIGNDNPDIVFPLRIVKGSHGDPAAVKTVLGWTASGKFKVEPGHGRINLMSCGEEATDNYLHDLIKSSFSTEDFGVKPAKLKGHNLEEKRAWKILDETAKKVDGSWEVGLLWRQDNVRIHDGESSALIRLSYTEKKMQDPVFASKYKAKIAEYLEKGYLKKLTNGEAAIKPPHTRYIPHFGQINPNKPEKFRFILDAKAKVGGVSLNDKLMKGPDLIRPLIAVLWNFRIHKVALTGDVTDMFHRVRIRKEDRCSQRILWRDGDRDKTPDHYQMEVMIFGATSSPSSAIYIKNRNAADFQEKYPSTAAIIVSDYYVDDTLTGGNSVDEVVAIRQQMSEIMDAGNFKVCKFLSNSTEVLASIPEDLKAEGVKGLHDKEDFPSERVLGLWWDPNEDIFKFNLTLHKVKKRVLDGETPTKREMCGLIMSLYDPLGFISHFKVKGLMLLQDVWRAGVGWDDEIPSSTEERWKGWLTMLHDITNVRIPRCYSHLLHGADEVQLHIFQDASEEAFACVCYLRIKVGGGIAVAFVCARARVAPLKKLTIPKLELQAAILGKRMAITICEELRVSISSRWFWSDSRTVLAWLRSTGVRYKEFVANRVGEIQEDTNASEWHWVPTKLNVADQATRYQGDISFSPESEWYTGPAFLKEDPSNFPAEKMEETTAIFSTIGAPEMDEEKPFLWKHSTCSATELVPSPSRFSKYLRLVRSTAMLLKCAKYWLKKWRKENAEPPLTPTRQSKINGCDVKEAEVLILKLLQHQAYPEEITMLKMKKPVGKRSSVWRLGPFLDDNGIMRLDGRIGVAKVPEEVKFPIILPPRHLISELIIDAEHVNCAHHGAETVLCNLRQRYWIVEGRKAVQRSWIRCQECRLKKAKPIPPRMGSLPYFRLASDFPPFSHTGLDFFGPMEVTVGRRHEKRWGALFTCGVTRAVHLEVCHALSTDEVMMALSRFVDARGRPHRIFSDNGTNFVRAAKDLKMEAEKVDFLHIMGHGKYHEIQWNFNPPAAPHMGGSWERLVQSVKKCLHCILHAKFPKDTTLLTMLKSVENIVNSRPITHASCDPADPQPLTPNHFLRGNVDFGPSIPCKSEANDELLRAQWKRAQVMADQFWTRWSREFLPKLLRREKWHEHADPLELGALVYMVDDRQPRNCWIRGYVSAVFPGADGQVRVAEVTTRDFLTRKTTTYKRPVTKLCPLGLRMEIPRPADAKFGAGNVADGASQDALRRKPINHHI